MTAPDPFARTLGQATSETSIRTVPVGVMYTCWNCKRRARIDYVHTYQRTEGWFEGRHFRRSSQHEWSTDAPVVRVPSHASPEYPPVLRCPSCGAGRMQGKPIEGHVTETPCGAKCLHAKGHVCECSCETVLGSAWFFHDDRAAAHSAVYVSIPCRTYRELPGEQEESGV